MARFLLRRGVSTRAASTLSVTSAGGASSSPPEAVAALTPYMAVGAMLIARGLDAEADVLPPHVADGATLIARGLLSLGTSVGLAVESHARTAVAMGGVSVGATAGVPVGATDGVASPCNAVLGPLIARCLVAKAEAIESVRMIADGARLIAHF